MKPDLAIKTKQHDVGLMSARSRRCSRSTSKVPYDALMSEKETLDRAEYKKRKQESTDIKTFFTEDLVALERLVFSVFQYKMLSEMAAAEVI